MKKFTLLALICLFTSITVNAQLILHESFEYFNSSNYTLSTQAAVSNTMVAAGYYSMKLSGGVGSHTDGFSITLPNNSQPEYFSCWIYTGGTSTTKSKAYVVIGDGTTLGSALFFYYISSSSSFRISNGTFTSLVDAPLNEWFKLEMHNINYTTHTFDFYINGEMRFQGIPFRDMTLNSITNIRLYNFTSATAAEAYTYYDEVIIGEYGPHVTCQPLTTAYSIEDTICEGDDITFVSQSPVSSGNEYVWSEFPNATLSSIMYSSDMPTYLYTPTAIGNNTMYAARSCLNDNIITTHFNGGTGSKAFLFNVYGKNTLLIDSLAFNMLNATSNTDYDFTLYIKDSTYVGYETDVNAWTVVSTQTINSGDLTSPLIYDITSTPIVLTSGIAKALCLMCTSSLGSVSYSVIATGETHQYNDANIMIYGGAGTTFSSSYSPRMPNILQRH